MIPFYLIVIASILHLVESGSYQNVQFFRKPTPRISRSFESFNFPLHYIDSTPELWAEEYDPSNSLSVNFHHLDPYLSPNLHEGFYDPLLLTGTDAKRAVAYLYSKELFFDRIPHVRAVLANQEKRTRNGLSGHRLGSLRPQSPFYRFKSFY